MLTLLLASALAAPPSWSVTVTRRTGIDTELGLTLAEQFSDALRDQVHDAWGTFIGPRAFSVALAAENTPDAAVCSGATDCVCRLGQLGQVQRLVSLHFAKAGSEVVIDAELLDVAKGDSVSSVTATVPLKRADAALEALASRLFKGAQPPPPVPVVAVAPPKAEPVKPPPDAPVVVAVTPAVEPAAPEVTAVATLARPGPWVLTGLGAASAVLGGVLLAVGSEAYGKTQAARTGLTTADALKRYQQANALRTGGVAALAVGAVAAGVGVTWLLLGSARSDGATAALVAGPASLSVVGAF